MEDVGVCGRKENSLGDNVCVCVWRGGIKWRKMQQEEEEEVEGN